MSSRHQDNHVEPSIDDEAASNRKPIRFSLRTLMLSITLIGLAIPLLSILCSTRGGISYFSPDTLEFKYQSERLLFLTPIPTYRSGFKYRRNELIEDLIEHGYWSPQNVENPRWMLTNYWNHQWKDGHSSLHRELSWREEKWIEWTKTHPEIAAVVWPLVLQALRSNPSGYEAGETAIEILGCAERATDLSEFKRNVASQGLSAKLVVSADMR